MEQQTIQLQEILMNLTEENLENTLDFLLNSNYILHQQNIYQLVHNFFIAASCRPKNMIILSNLLFSLYASSSNNPTPLKFIPQAIQDEAKYNPYPPYYFFYCLMKSGFPNDFIINCLVDQYEHSPRKCLINQKKKIFKDDQIFYGYSLFVPELIEAGKFDWFGYLIDYYNDKQYQIINPKEDDSNQDSTFSEDDSIVVSEKVELFIEEYPTLSANNFERYREFRDFGWNPDEFYIAIQNDDDTRLKSLFEESDIEDICEFVNKPIRWSAFERCQFLQNNPLPIHIASFYSSAKCFSFLISMGADLNATDSCGRTVVQFAIAGGCEDLRMFDRNKCSYEGALHIAAKFHRYQYFELIYSNLSKFNSLPKKASNLSSTSISSQTTGGYSTTADTSDIEGDSTGSSIAQTKPKIMKTEIKTRSGSKPKPASKPKTETVKPKTTTKSKTSFGVGLTASLALNGPQAYLTNNIKGLGSILHQAALSNCLRILTSLLSKSHQKDVKNNSSFEIDLNEFVNEPANSEKCSDFGPNYFAFLTDDTPLIVAVKSYNIETINFLLSLNSVDINARSATWMKSPLHVAAKRGYNDVLKILLKNDRIDFNPKDINGRTPVFEAAYYMKYDILRILAECEDVDFKIKDKNGKKPSEIELIMPVDSECEIYYGELIRLLRKCCH